MIHLGESVGTAARVQATDETLMMRYQRGDVAAFSALVDRHQTPIYNFILRQVRSEGAAEDLAQEVFVRVVEKAASFKHEARFTTWAYTIARNLCIDHLRKAAYRRHASLDQPEDGGETEGGTLNERVPDLHPRASTERTAVSAEIQTKIVQAVEALPREQREVFLLREVANLSFQEISTITDAPENTVKSRMRYALERLQEALTEFEEYARALR
jgi:RNA polymerase sigma-70 factor, ECF subfamily